MLKPAQQMALIPRLCASSSCKAVLCLQQLCAQDQFLEALLDKGIDDIVRIGSKSKSKRLEPYNLFTLAGSGQVRGGGWLDPHAPGVPGRAGIMKFLSNAVSLRTRVPQSWV
jgi:hypothetical protein